MESIPVPRPPAELPTEAELMSTWKGDPEKPLVTVLCTTYNHEAFIRDALHGFLIQRTTFPFRVVVHDDASQDETQSIIREYTARYPHILKAVLQKQNLHSRGLSRKPYIDPLIAGSFIAKCEGDDYWISTKKLQMQVDFLQSQPSFSMVFHNAWHLKEGEETVTPFSDLKGREYKGEDLLADWIVPTASVMYSRKMIDTRSYEGKPFYGDIISFLRCAEGGRVYGMDTIMSVYRRHSGGMTRTNKEIPFLERTDRLIEHWRYVGNAFDRRYKRIAAGKMARLFFLRAWASKDSQVFQAYTDLFRAFRNEPTITSSLLYQAIKKRVLKDQ